MYYNVKAKVEVLDENNYLQRVTELYNISAEGITDAEVILTKVLSEHADGNFSVFSATPNNYALDILVKEKKIAESDSEDSEVSEEGSEWWIVTVSEIISDEGEKEKRKNISHIVQADDVKEAIAMMEVYSPDASSYIVGVKHHDIVDVKGGTLCPINIG